MYHAAIRIPRLGHGTETLTLWHCQVRPKFWHNVLQLQTGGELWEGEAEALPGVRHRDFLVPCRVFDLKGENDSAIALIWEGTVV